MTPDQDMFDFAEDQGPDVPDGVYEATCSAEPSKKPTKNGGWMAFLRFTIVSAHDDANSAAAGADVSKVFVPPDPARDKPTRVRLFAVEVKKLCAALEVSPPKVPLAQFQTAEGWADFFEEIEGRHCTIKVANKRGKDGVDRAEISFP